jgi:Lysylphosphatidylglycerol synthase TM region
MRSNKNIKIFINYWLGPVLFLWLSWSIYQQVRHQPDIKLSWYAIVDVFTGGEIFKCLIVLGLMAVNWGIEAKKWVVLLRPIHQISFLRALQAILAGVAFAVNTPNRIGEYGGRILYLPAEKRLAAVSLTLIGSISQLLVTLWVGAIGLWLFYLGLPGVKAGAVLNADSLWLKILYLLIAGMAALLLFIYLRIGWLVKLIEKIPISAKWLKAMLVADELRVTILLRVLGWSMLRYVVFVIQYILLLQIFNVTTDVYAAWWMISIVFLALAIIPTIAMAELGIRGKLALELFGFISANQLGIISATISIWLVNLVLPAILGSLLIIRIKIFTSRQPKEK